MRPSQSQYVSPDVDQLRRDLEWDRRYAKITVCPGCGDVCSVCHALKSCCLEEGRKEGRPRHQEYTYTYTRIRSPGGS